MSFSAAIGAVVPNQHKMYARSTVRQKKNTDCSNMSEWNHVPPEKPTHVGWERRRPQINRIVCVCVCAEETTETCPLQVDEAR